MALQKEIWINAIIEGLFADNTFASRSIDHSPYVNDKTVHVPNAGTPPEVKKNRTDLPASISQRTDTDLTYSINEYTTSPIRVSHAEQVELSYSKRNSVIAGARSALQESVHADLVYSWVPAAPEKIETSGSAISAHIAGATGNRKAFVKKDVLAVKKKFDSQDIPQTGRCMLLDADMYGQLLESLTEAESFAFLSTADASTGVIGKLYGFDFYMRSKVAKATSAGVLKSWETSAAATDCAAAIAWQDGCVSRAMGETVLFEDEKSPTYYSDIISALVRAGGASVRSDKKGVCLIYQGTAAKLD